MFDHSLTHLHFKDVRLLSSNTAEDETLSCLQKDFFYNFIHISIYSDSEDFTFRYLKIYGPSWKVRLQEIVFPRLHASDQNVHCSRDMAFC